MQLNYKKLNGKQFAYTVNDTGCHVPTLKPINNKGYVQAYFSDSQFKRKKRYLHRIVFESYYRIPIKRRRLVHTCGNHACFNHEHLDLKAKS